MAAAPDRHPEAFADLTWHELDEWAGSEVVRRGKNYVKRVLKLRITPEDGLAANVVGTSLYRTRVDRSGAGELDSACTCPYDRGPCKHAVAVILAALEALKRKRPLPFGGSDDDDPAQVEPAEDGLRSAVPRRRNRGGASERKAVPRARADTPGSLRDYVTGLSKGELVEVILDLAETVPDAHEWLRDRRRLDADEAGLVVRAVRRQIESLAAEPAWSNHWSGEGHTPDYAPVRARLEAMLAAGYADEVVALGEDLLRLGTEQVGMSDDEGELAADIGRCLEVVFRALPDSSLSPADQVLWEIDARMQDEYAVLEGMEGPASSDDVHAPEEWSDVADALARRLRASPDGSEGEEPGAHARDWRRTQLLRELTSALEKAGRTADALAVLEQEAFRSHCHRELVDALLAVGRREDAHRWAETGFHATLADLPGIAWDLEERLRLMAEEDGDARLVAAYRALEFLRDPGLDSYVALRDASTSAKAWNAIVPRVLRYLEGGEVPDAAPDWPLPPTGLRAAPRRQRSESFPLVETLVRIAVEEGCLDDAVAWYRRIPAGPGHLADPLGDELASAVRRTHPEVALGIWRRRAEAWIGRVNPSAYRAAGSYLERMATLYRELERTEEWRAYLDELRTANRRRPRMMEVLESVEGKRRRIVEG